MTPSDGRPLFASGFPRTPPLDDLVEAFARGDYARVRSVGRKLSASAPEGEVRAAARTLVARTEPDPLAILLLVLAGALLVTLSAYWIVHGKPAPADAPNAPHEQSTSVRTR